MVRKKEQTDFKSELEFHRREWRVERVGWVLLAVFLILAVAGLFGSGPLSHVRSGSKDGGSIEYERFVRHGSITALRVRPAATLGHGAMRIEIAASYLRAFRIERIDPEPSSVVVSGERLVYEFAAAPAGAQISFHLHPEELGSHAAQVVIDAAEPLTIRQFTYP